MQMIDLLVILPLLIIIGWILVLLMVDLVIPPGKKWITALLAVLGLMICIGFGHPAAHRRVNSFQWHAAW